ncbi:MAG: alpha/beta hydrolase [Pricia sp.]
MKPLPKLLRPFRYLGILLLTLCVGASVYTCVSVPKVSKENKAVIKEVMRSPLPEIVKGSTGFVESQGWKVWYEDIRPESLANGTSKGTVVLVMGAANDALSWPLDFISKFTDAGYRVIRYDHRGTGLTTSKEGWDRKNPYTLADMAQDPLAILDTLNIQKAHFVGVSMGGMISQRVAIDYPERILSLTSIMSSGNVMDGELPSTDLEILPEMISAIVKQGILGGKKGKIKLQLVHKKILMGEATGDIAAKPVAEAALYNLKKRDGYNFMAGRQHQKGIEISSSRYEDLKKLTLPVLVVHGEQDPVIPIAHGKKMVSLVPNADSLWLTNMGHNLPDTLLDTIAERAIGNFERKLD